MEVIEEIMRELEQCREDERNSRGEILQVIMAVCTALTIVFGASSLLKEITIENKRWLFYFIVFVLCIAGAYITSIGIINVLRYHYMRQLEDYMEEQKRSSLITDVAKTERNFSIVHWISFSGTVGTKNIKHVKSVYTKFTYGGYIIATAFAIILCVLITGYQYLSIEDHNLFDNFLIVFLIVFSIALCVIFAFFTTKAADMCQWAYEESQKRREERLYRYKAKIKSSGSVVDKNKRF